MVTIPTVRISISLAVLAMIGAAPVPVPPPIPAVINTIYSRRSTFLLRLLYFLRLLHVHAPGGFRLLILLSQLQLHGNGGFGQRLVICVAHNKCYIVYTFFIHVIYGIAAATSHTDYFNDSRVSAGKSNGIIVSSDIIFYIILR